jgi:hypothetical protein
MSQIIVPEWQKPVVRIPLNQAFPQMGEIKEFKNRICLFSEDRSRLYDVVSPRYQLVEHGAGILRIQEGLERYFGKGSSMKPSVRTFTGGARLNAEFKLPIKVKIARDDESEVTVKVRNSYDRSCSFMASLGTLRLVCTNGATVGEEWGSVRMKHINVDQEDEQARKEADADLMHQIDLMVTQAPKLKEKWSEWADKKIDLLTATNAIQGAFPRMYTDPILDEAKWKTERTMWQFYNDLTYMSSHLTKSMQRRQTFDDRIAALFYGDGINTAQMAGDDELED